MIDIGTNLLHAQFDSDRSEVLERAKRCGVDTIIVTATCVASARAAQRFLGEVHLHPAWPNLFASAGVHPHDAGAVAEDYLDQLRSILAEGSVAAVGEAGLDFNRNFTPREQQIAVFDEHVKLAKETNLPLFVHDRESDGLVLQTLQTNDIDPSQVIIHCFTGTAEELAAYLDAGYWIGITGWVCDRRRGQPLRDIVTNIPIDRLLVETDAPFLLPHTIPKHHDPQPRGRRNEPGYLSFVVEQLAQLYQTDTDTLAAVTQANAQRAFNLPTTP